MYLLELLGELVWIEEQVLIWVALEEKLLMELLISGTLVISRITGSARIREGSRLIQCACSRR